MSNRILLLYFVTLEISGVPELWQTSDKKTDRQLGSLGTTRLWLCADFWLPESSWPLGQAYTYSFVSWCQLNMHKLTLFLCVLWLPLFFFRPGGNLSYNCGYTCIYNNISNSPDIVSNILQALIKTEDTYFSSKPLCTHRRHNFLPDIFLCDRFQTDSL